MSAIRTFFLELEGFDGSGAREVGIPFSSVLAWFDYIDPALRASKGGGAYARSRVLLSRCAGLVTAPVSVVQRRSRLRSSDPFIGA